MSNSNEPKNEPNEPQNEPNEPQNEPNEGGDNKGLVDILTQMSNKISALEEQVLTFGTKSKDTDYNQLYAELFVKSSVPEEPKEPDNPLITWAQEVDIEKLDFFERG